MCLLSFILQLHIRNPPAGQEPDRVQFEGQNAAQLQNAQLQDLQLHDRPPVEPPCARVKRGTDPRVVDPLARHV